MNGVKCTDRDAYDHGAHLLVDSLYALVTDYETCIKKIEEQQEVLGKNIISAVGVLKQMQQGTDTAQEQCASAIKTLDQMLNAAEEIETSKVF